MWLLKAIQRTIFNIINYSYINTILSLVNYHYVNFSSEESDRLQTSFVIYANQMHFKFTIISGKVFRFCYFRYIIFML